REVRAETVMLASGRVPNVESLNLEAVGVETSRAGIVVDDRLRTSVNGIWAAGDVTAVARADRFADESPAADYSVLPTSIFTDPELGSVGLTEAQAREQGHAVEAV